MPRLAMAIIVRSFPNNEPLRKLADVKTAAPASAAEIAALDAMF